METNDFFGINVDYCKNKWVYLTPQKWELFSGGKAVIGWVVDYSKPQNYSQGLLRLMSSQEV